jgi:hypothetical protein
MECKGEGRLRIFIRDKTWKVGHDVALIWTGNQDLKVDTSCIQESFIYLFILEKEVHSHLSSPIFLFYFINISIQISQLILQVLKLTTM